VRLRTDRWSLSLWRLHHTLGEAIRIAIFGAVSWRLLLSRAAVLIRRITEPNRRRKMQAPNPVSFLC
jgi:hypothetical protein